MIDLDEQLAAYATYLDDTERSVTVLYPRAVTPRVALRRRFVAGAAAAVVLAGAAAIVVVRSGDDGATGTADSAWTVVPDPDGVFVPPPGVAEAGPEHNRSVSSNAIFVRSLEAVSDGFVAVGTEHEGFAPVGALWRSADGVNWERVQDPSFGIDGFSEDPDADGPSMVGVAERDGRVVVAGSLSQFDEPAVWITEDWESWDVLRVDGADADTQPTAIAGGADGFVMVGVDYGLNQNVQDTGVAWFSPDGEVWTAAIIEDSWGARIGDVLHTDRGWLASGSIGSAAAVWSSTDGLTWGRESVEQTPEERLRFTSINHLVEFDGRIVGYGSAESSGGVRLESGRSDPDEVVVNGTVQPAVWINGAGSSWSAVSPVAYESATARYPSVIVATDDELIAFGQELDVDRFVTMELRSSDGVTWRRVPNTLPGARHAATFADGIAVTAGDDQHYVATHVGTPGPSPAWPSGAITLWTLRD